MLSLSLPESSLSFDPVSWSSASLDSSSESPPELLLSVLSSEVSSLLSSEASLSLSPESGSFFLDILPIFRVLAALLSGLSPASSPSESQSDESVIV